MENEPCAANRAHVRRSCIEGVDEDGRLILA